MRAGGRRFFLNYRRPVATFLSAPQTQEPGKPGAAMSIRAVSILLIGLTATSVSAQNAPEGWRVGIVTGVGTSPYLGEDVSTTAVPFLSYSTDRFSIGANGGQFQVYETPTHSLDLVLTPRFTPYDDATAELAGMDRDITLDFGASLDVDLSQTLGISATALQEITGEHEGQEVDFRLSHRSNAMPLTFYAGATWQSAGLSEYLYGVRAGEAAVGRPAYAPGAVLTPYVGISTALPVGDRAVILGTIEARQFGDRVTDSPIINETGSTRASVGVAFQF